MIRNLLALLLVGAAVGLFVFLVFQSRPVSVEMHVPALEFGLALLVSTSGSSTGSS